MVAVIVAKIEPNDLPLPFQLVEYQKDAWGLVNLILN